MEDLSKEEYKKYLKEYRERGSSFYKKARNKSIDKAEREEAYRQHLNCSAMIRNMNHKMTHGEWLYNDLPNGNFVKTFRVLASGDPKQVGALIDSFGREYDVPRKRN